MRNLQKHQAKSEFGGLENPPPPNRGPVPDPGWGEPRSPGAAYNPGSMWLYGRNPLREAIRAGQPVERVLVAEGSRLPPDLLRRLRQQGVPVETVPRARIEHLAGGHRGHQGVVFRLAVRSPEPPERVLQRILEDRAFGVYLDRVQDPQNLGNLLRSAYAFGARGALWPARGSAPLSPVVLKASAGALLHLPVARTGNPVPVLQRFQAAGGRVYAVETGGVPLSQWRFQFPALFVFGGEGTGIRKPVLRKADAVVTVEMEGNIASLNVAAAAAVVLYRSMMDRRTG